MHVHTGAKSSNQTSRTGSVVSAHVCGVYSKCVDSIMVCAYMRSHMCGIHVQTGAEATTNSPRPGPVRSCEADARLQPRNPNPRRQGTHVHVHA